MHTEKLSDSVLSFLIDLTVDQNDVQGLSIFVDISYHICIYIYIFKYIFGISGGVPAEGTVYVPTYGTACATLCNRQHIYIYSVYIYIEREREKESYMLTY